MSLVTPFAAAGKSSSFLPTIKCSNCAREIEIARMGEHDCVSGTAGTLPANGGHAQDMGNPFMMRQTTFDDANQNNQYSQPRNQEYDTRQQNPYHDQYSQGYDSQQQPQQTAWQSPPQQPQQTTWQSPPQQQYQQTSWQSPAPLPKPAYQTHYEHRQEQQASPPQHQNPYQATYPGQDSYQEATQAPQQAPFPEPYHETNHDNYQAPRNDGYQGMPNGPQQEPQNDRYQQQQYMGQQQESYAEQRAQAYQTSPERNYPGEQNYHQPPPQPTTWQSPPPLPQQFSPNSPQQREPMRQASEGMPRMRRPTLPSTGSYSQDPSRNPRMALPKINSNVTNGPHLTARTAVDAPRSPAFNPRSGTSQNGRPPLGRSQTNPRPRLWDPRPPSTEISVNLDCAFPPFPSAAPQKRRPSAGQGRKTPTPSERAGSRSASRSTSRSASRNASRSVSKADAVPSANEPALPTIPPLEDLRDIPPNSHIAPVLAAPPGNQYGTQMRSASGDSYRAQSPVTERQPSETFFGAQPPAVERRTSETFFGAQPPAGERRTSEAFFESPPPMSPVKVSEFPLAPLASHEHQPVDDRTDAHDPYATQFADTGHEHRNSAEYNDVTKAEPLPVQPEEPPHFDPSIDRLDFSFGSPKIEPAENEHVHAVPTISDEMEHLKIADESMAHEADEFALAPNQIPQVVQAPPRGDSRGAVMSDHGLDDSPPLPKPVQRFRQDSKHTSSEFDSFDNSRKNSLEHSSTPLSSVETAASSVEAFPELSFENAQYSGEDEKHADAYAAAPPAEPLAPMTAQSSAEPPRKFSMPRNFARPGPPRDAQMTRIDPVIEPVESPMDPAMQGYSGAGYGPWGTPAPQVAQSFPEFGQDSNETKPKRQPEPLLIPAPRGDYDSSAPRSPLAPLYSPAPSSSGRSAGSDRSVTPIPRPPNEPEDAGARRPMPRRATIGKPICRGCSLPIEGKSVKAADGRLTGRWHKACFVCRSCQEPFTTADFYVINNEPYCERHYHEQNGSICAGCNRGIEGQYTETTSTLPGRIGAPPERKKFHPRCFTCRECRVVLVDDYFEISGNVFCERHAFAVMRAQQARMAPNGFGRGGPRGMQDRSGLKAERRTTKLMMMNVMR